MTWSQILGLLAPVIFNTALALASGTLFNTALRALQLISSPSTCDGGLEEGAQRQRDHAQHGGGVF